MQPIAERLLSESGHPSHREVTPAETVTWSHSMEPTLEDSQMLFKLQCHIPQERDVVPLPLYSSLYAAFHRMQKLRESGVSGYIIGRDLALFGTKSDGSPLRISAETTKIDALEALQAFKAAHNTGISLGMVISHTATPEMHVAGGLYIPITLRGDITREELLNFVVQNSDFLDRYPGGMVLNPQTLRTLLSKGKSDLSIWRYEPYSLRGRLTLKKEFQSRESKQALHDPENRIYTIASNAYDELLYRQLWVSYHASFQPVVDEIQ